MLGVSLV